MAVVGRKPGSQKKLKFVVGLVEHIMHLSISLKIMHAIVHKG